MSIKVEKLSQISVTHYFPAMFSRFDSLSFILAILYTAMSTTRATIATLTTPFMAKVLRKMMTATAPNTQSIAMMICIFKPLFFRMDRNG